MNDGAFVSHWIDWRELRGRSGRHRRTVDEWLQSHPALLYFGDSWFSTPLYPNLAVQSSQRIRGIGMLAGRPGGTAAEMLTPRTVRDLVARLEGGGFDTMVVSLGGNDALADRLETVFKPWMGGRKARIDADTAFERLVEHRVFTRIHARYESLLVALKASRRLQPHFRVLGHGYARLVRIGVPAQLTLGNIGLMAIIKNQTGPWLYGPMAKVLPDEAEALRFSRRLLEDGFRDRVLESLVQAHGDLFSYVEFDGIPFLEQPEAWYDEIHPDPLGFEAMVPRLNAGIRRALPGHKQHAVSLQTG